MQKIQVRFLHREDRGEKEMATHSSILAWRIPWTEEPGGLQSMGSQESDTTERLNHYLDCDPLGLSFILRLRSVATLYTRNLRSIACQGTRSHADARARCVFHILVL